MLQVHILTPKRQAFTGEANEVRAPGWLGEFGVLPGHDLFLSLLRGGICTVITDKGEQRFVVGRGFVEAGPDRVTVLTDSAVPAESVDKAGAEKDIVDADAVMSGVDMSSHEWAVAEERLEIARAKLLI
jgi:F-type H+-transporting ATPase subunit epsilon